MVSPEIIQQARDIVADIYVRDEPKNGKPTHYATHAAWRSHIDRYSRFLREGAYDDNLAVKATIAALATTRVQA